MRQVEPFDRLLAADDLVVAVTPAEAQQVIGNRFREQAEFVAIGIHAQSPVPLRQLRSVRPIARMIASWRNALLR